MKDRANWLAIALVLAVVVLVIVLLLFGESGKEKLREAIRRVWVRSPSALLSAVAPLQSAPASNSLSA